MKGVGSLFQGERNIPYELCTLENSIASTIAGTKAKRPRVGVWSACNGQQMPNPSVPRHKGKRKSKQGSMSIHIDSSCIHHAAAVVGKQRPVAQSFLVEYEMLVAKSDYQKSVKTETTRRDARWWWWRPRTNRQRIRRSAGSPSLRRRCSPA